MLFRSIAANPNVSFSGNFTTAVTGTNASQGNSAPGAGSLFFLNPVNLFVSTISGSEDLHLISTALTVNAGTDLVTTPAYVNIDIDGRDVDALGDVWDIGADEGVFAPGPSAPTGPVPGAGETGLGGREPEPYARRREVGYRDRDVVVPPAKVRYDEALHVEEPEQIAETFTKGIAALSEQIVQLRALPSTTALEEQLLDLERRHADLSTRRHHLLLLLVAGEAF